MDREARVLALVEHARNPRRKGILSDADVMVPGGSPKCGGSVVVFLKGDGNGGIHDVFFTGEGDTISMGATSMVLEKVHEGNLTMEEVLDLDYLTFLEGLGWQRGVRGLLRQGGPAASPGQGHRRRGVHGRTP